VPKMRPGEGITGTAAAERAPVMIPRDAHLDPRFKSFPNLREEQYQSILAVPILASRPWPAATAAGRSPAPSLPDTAGRRGALRGRASRTVASGTAPPPAPQEREVSAARLEGALNVRTEAPREFSQAEIDLLMAIAGQVAQAIENAKLYDHAQRRVAELEALAAISEAVSESLYLEESLEAIVQTTMAAVGATGAALVLEDGKVAWPEGRAGRYAARFPLRWKGRSLGELVCDRDTPFVEEEERLLASIAHHAAVAVEHGRAVMRGVVAQEIHHRVKNNLQTVASLLRLQARARDIDPRKALGDSVNRILAIAAVHEVLTEQRDEDVDLGELVERLRAMLVQGLGRGKHVRARVESIPLHGDRATALALVFSELLQNALEHGGDEVRVELERRDGGVSLTVSDNGRWDGAEDGTGLSIVRALVHDELRGTLTLVDGGGLRAEVAFPS
jgi:two-component sensor histidine kinase